MVALNHDASSYEPGKFEPLPAGEYVAQIESSEWKATKAGTGNYVSLMFKVIDGPHAGRTVYTNLNLDNPNKQAEEIAHKQLSELCHAIGKVRIDDTEELHGIPVVIVLKVSPGRDGYEPSNAIKRYKAAEGAAPAASPAASSSGSAPPWAGGEGSY